MFVKKLKNKYVSPKVHECFSDIQNVLGTQVKDQKTRRLIIAAGFLVITNGN